MRNPKFTNTLPVAFAELGKRILARWAKMSAEEARETLSYNLFEIFKQRFPEKFADVYSSDSATPLQMELPKTSVAHSKAEKKPNPTQRSLFDES